MKRERNFQGNLPQKQWERKEERFKEGLKKGRKRCKEMILDLILDLLYPRRCPLCEEILLPKEGLVCEKCRKKLPYIREPLCKKCGKKIRSWEQEYCSGCQGGGHLFCEGRAVFVYEKSLRRSIGRMKFQNRREYADFYAGEMGAVYKKSLRRWKIRTVIPVPMYAKKARRRGYDQSVLLAKKFGEVTGIPTAEGCLVRNRETLPQKELDAGERKKNLRGAFSIKKPELVREPVLLIDDIYTTGATVDAACQALQRQGISRIYFLVLAAGNGD